MAHHNVRLFDDTDHGDSYGTGVGARQDVDVVQMPSGVRHRIDRWNGALREVDVGYRVRSMLDMHRVYRFFLMRKGGTHSFPYKDWLDYASTTSGTTHLPDDVAVTRTDQTIGTGDGTTTQFQLVKKYTDASGTITRNITLPVSGTLLVEVNSVLQTEGVDYTVDYLSGIITFDTAPTSGHVIKAGFEFDVPMCFNITQEAFKVMMDAYDQGSAASIPLIEERDLLPVDDALPPLGGNHWAITIDTVIYPYEGQVHTLDVTVASKAVIIPNDLTQMACGIYYLFHNLAASTQSVAIKDGVAGSTVVTLSAGESAIVFIGYDTDGTTKKWFAVEAT